eukprot:2261197-Pyramimonas_sp.AAC.1
MCELRRALKSMKLRRGSDEFGVVAEMFKKSSYKFMALLLHLFNEMLREGAIGPTWRETLFSMPQRQAISACRRLGGQSQF